MAEQEQHGVEVAILGGGNVGQALARGLVQAGSYRPAQVAVTRRTQDKLSALSDAGFVTGSDNVAMLAAARLVVIAVQPQQVAGLAGEIRDALDSSRHIVMSVVSGVPIDALAALLGQSVPIVRAMPNTAIEIGQSMTCLAAGSGSERALAEAEALFGTVGTTLAIAEEMMVPATALCACGIAFFLRSIRAASQGGIEIGFHPEEAMTIAAQTALGAASLLLRPGSHPEAEIDRVTTPRGCTITGLNEMEHRGFSSAMIKGIITSAREAGALLTKDLD